MYRGHEDYDPNRLGAISQVRVAAALIETGKLVWIPCMQETRTDLIIEDGDHLYRVQCKTGQLFRGAVFFRPHSLRAAKKETEWRRIARNYRGQIDYFGIYCPDNGKVYLVPIKDVQTTRACSLRIAPPKNNQRNGIRWAKDYEVSSVEKELLHLQ
jgi:hypothetical protein